MSTQGKMIKDLVRVKKESMMGKLANEFDPMEPWSAKSDAPIKNSKGLSEEESLDEANNKILFNYIKSLGYDPKFMPFAKLSTYSRSDAFKRFKQGHVFDKSKQDIKTEQAVAEGSISDLLNKDPTSPKFNDHSAPRKTKHSGSTPTPYEQGRLDAHRKKSYNNIHNSEQDAEDYKTGYRHVKSRQDVAEANLSELNRDTLHSYASKADKQIVAKHRVLGPQIKAGDAKAANKTSATIGKRMAGLDRATERLNKEETSICTSCQVDPCICDDSHGFVNEAGTGHLMSFIKAKGLNPLAMDGNQKRAYSRSSEYRIFKSKHHAEAIKETSGMGERADDWNEASSPAQQAAIAINMKKKGIKPKKVQESKDPGEYDYEGSMAKTLLQTICRNADDLKNMLDDDENLPEWVQSKITKAEDYITASLDYLKSTQELEEEVEHIEELSKSTLKSYVDKVVTTPGRGMTPKGTLKSIKAIGGVTKALRKQYEKPLSELKKTPDNMDSDTIGLAREDLRKWFSKTNPEGDWKRINSKFDAVGPCAREPGEPKPKCMSQKTRSELSKSERAAAVATKRKNDPVADRAGKGGKPVNVSNYGKGKLSEDEIDEACWDTHKQVGTKMKGGKMVPNCVPKNEEVEQIDEKNSPTNPTLWSRAKSMARSKFDVYPSAYANGWASKWYKSKGGGWKSVKEDTVQEGIYGIEDSPMAATHSVKAMESKKISNAAKMVKAIHKKRVNETTYDWEKSEKGGDADPEIKTTAKVTLKGGKTMTGKPRDTVEIEPVLRTKINRPNGMKPNV
jgi:hypothetical protein